MKKRRNLIISLLLVAAIALGVGYASLSSRLVVNGTGNIDADSNNFKLEFVAAEDNVDGDEHSHAHFDGATASFDVSHIDKKGESITFTFTFKNTSPGQSKAYIDKAITETTKTLILDEDDSTDIGIDTYYDITTNIGVTELAYGETGTLTVTVTCKETITDNVTLTYNFYIEGHSSADLVKQ